MLKVALVMVPAKKREVLRLAFHIEIRRDAKEVSET
jgi:hypothetical protein